MPSSKQPQLIIEPSSRTSSSGELARDKKVGGRLVTVHFLDDTQHVFPIDVSHRYSHTHSVPI